MSDSTLLPQLWQTLQPYLPVLLTEAAKAGGKRVPDAVARVWQTLVARLRREPAGREALDDLRRAPEDPDLQAVVRVRVRKLLDADPAWAANVAALLRAAGVQYQAELRGDGAIAQGPGATAAGKGAVHIRGDAHGNIIITGDDAQVNA